MPNTRLVRHFITGELQEVPFVTEKGHGIVARIGENTRRTGNFWRKGHRSMAIAVHPKQAKQFTLAARAAGINDVRYSEKTGEMIATSRIGRAQEAARRGWVDRDGGHIETKWGKLVE